MSLQQTQKEPLGQKFQTSFKPTFGEPSGYLFIAFHAGVHVPERSFDLLYDVFRADSVLSVLKVPL